MSAKVKVVLAELALFAALLLLALALTFGTLLSVGLSLLAISCAAMYLGGIE